VNEPSYADSERQWATDVLSRYFDSVGNSPSVDQARARFRALHAQSASPVAVPYAHKTLPQCPVDYDTLRTLFVRRRSVRWFLPKAVEPQLIERAIDAAALAPSACNRQPFRFEVVCDPEQAARMAACANGTAGFSENLPCLMVIVGDLSAYPFERDRHIIYLDGGLVSMQLMLALETLGLGSCPINWPDIPHLEAPLRKALALKPHEQAMMLIAVGYPDPEGGVLYSGKKPCDVLMHACQPDLPPSR
jgi:nitroreductase